MALEKIMQGVVSATIPGYLGHKFGRTLQLYSQSTDMAEGLSPARHPGIYLAGISLGVPIDIGLYCLYIPFLSNAMALNPDASNSEGALIMALVGLGARIGGDTILNFFQEQFGDSLTNSRRIRDIHRFRQG